MHIRFLLGIDGRSWHMFARSSSALKLRSMTFHRESCASWKARSNDRLPDLVSTDRSRRPRGMCERLCSVAATILPILFICLSVLAEHRLGLPAASHDVSPRRRRVGIQHSPVIGIWHTYHRDTGHSVHSDCPRDGETVRLDPSGES